MISVYDTISGIAPEEWDVLAGNNVMASHGWLKTVETTCIVPFRARYITVRFQKHLAGAAVCYIVPRTDQVETIDDMLFGRLRPIADALGLSRLPAFVCGPLHSYGWHAEADHRLDPQRRAAVRPALLDAIEAEARAEGLHPTFTNVLDQQTALVQLLQQRGYLRFSHIPLNYLDVQWSSFDEYLNHLNTITHGAKKDVRRHISKNLKGSTRIEIADRPGLIGARLHELLEGNSLRYNGRPFSFRAEFFGELKRNLGDDARIYTASKGGAITAVNVMLRRNGVAQMPMVGVDHEAAGRDFTYFNVALYRPIRDAISERVERIYYGRALYDLKARKGCRIANLSIYHKATGPSRFVLRPWCSVLSAWNRYRLPKRVRR